MQFVPSLRLRCYATKAMFIREKLDRKFVFLQHFYLASLHFKLKGLSVMSKPNNWSMNSLLN